MRTEAFLLRFSYRNKGKIQGSHHQPCADLSSRGPPVLGVRWACVQILELPVGHLENLLKLTFCEMENMGLWAAHGEMMVFKMVKLC